MTDMTWLWRVLVSSAMAVAIGLGGWSISAVANMPKEYTTKEELRQLRKENREDHKDLSRKIDQLISRGE